MYGQIIKTLRKKTGITQEELAKSVGFKSASAVGMVEREERQVNFDMLVKIADFFNVSTDFLLEKTEVVECPICSLIYAPLIEEDYNEHELFHNKICESKNSNLYINFRNRERIKKDSIKIINANTSTICSLFQIDTNVSSVLYGDLPVVTFADRIKKAKLMTGVSQEELSKLTGLSRATISDLEAGYRDTVTIDTLYKLISVLDKDILLDDYHKYILTQEEHISELIKSHGITKLCSLIKSHHTTVYNWSKGKYTITKNKYELIKRLGLNP